VLLLIFHHNLQRKLTGLISESRDAVSKPNGTVKTCLESEELRGERVPLLLDVDFL